MTSNKYEGYFSYYISRANDRPLLELLNEQELSIGQFFSKLSSEKIEYAYDEGKWTVKEVLFHIIETEIIMMYRAIRISRGDTTPMPGYDENLMIKNSRVSTMNIDDLLSLFRQTRKTTLFYYNYFSQEDLQQSGTFSENDLDVKGIGYLIAGHAIHHMEIIEERYLA